MEDTDNKEKLLPKFNDEDKSLSIQYLNINRYTLLTSIPEMISEWWAYSGKSAEDFLKSEELSEVIDEKIFIDILIGKYKFSTRFLSLLQEKIPYNITLNKLYSLNKSFAAEHPEAEILSVDSNKLQSLLRKIYLRKKESKKKRIKKWQQENKEAIAESKARYRESHKEEIREKKRKYRETHREQIKAYKKSRREITNRQQREKYHADIEKSREKGRMYSKRYKEQNRDKVLLSQRKYREKHKDDIKQRLQERLENAEYCEHLRMMKRASYHKNAAQIQQRKTQRRLENLEEALLKERKYGEVYRNKHRAEINARSRAKYEENLLENRKKCAERTRKYRNKKRFKKETSKIIMPLLSAIAAYKANLSAQK